jgi:hypothetical protein
MFTPVQLPLTSLMLMFCLRKKREEGVVITDQRSACDGKEEV